MKNIKNIVAAFVMVAVLNVSSAFAGILVAGKDGILVAGKETKGTVCSSEVKVGNLLTSLMGILVAGKTGILVAGRDGILVAGKGCEQTRGGLLISD